MNFINSFGAYLQIDVTEINNWEEQLATQISNVN
jgi:hypothetical protein